MFKSTCALRNYLVHTQGITEDEIETVELAPGERMLVSKHAPSIPLGFVTITYMGMVPGRGQVNAIDARPA